jgi:hypothetical protein
MAYNDFTLEALKQQFCLRTDEKGDYFAQVAPAQISDWLRDYLHYYAPIALAIGTEKARSELLIMPILLEAHRQLDQRFSLFSGVEFNVDIDRGLGGVCDYVLSLSAEQLTIEAPVVAIVEAKNENIKQGITQCVAEMVAAQTFNRNRQNEISTVYGVVTTGSVWVFLRLVDLVVFVDRTEYHISQADRVVGILMSMITEAAEHQDALDLLHDAGTPAR